MQRNSAFNRGSFSGHSYISSHCELVNSPDFCDSPAVSDAILGSKGDRCDGRGRGVDLQAPPIVA